MAGLPNVDAPNAGCAGCPNAGCCCGCCCCCPKTGAAVFACPNAGNVVFGFDVEKRLVVWEAGCAENEKLGAPAPNAVVVCGLPKRLVF